MTVAKTDIDVSLTMENGEEVPSFGSDGRPTGYERQPIPGWWAVTPLGPAELRFETDVKFPDCQWPKGLRVVGYILHWEGGSVASDLSKPQKVRKGESVRVTVSLLHDFTEWNLERSVHKTANEARDFFQKSGAKGAP